MGLEGRAAGCPTRTTCCTASRPATRCRRAPTLSQPGRATTCEVLFFGSDRFDNSGDAQQGFWFFQNKIALGTNVGRRRHRLHRRPQDRRPADHQRLQQRRHDVDDHRLHVGPDVHEDDRQPDGSCGDANLRTLARRQRQLRIGAGDDAFCGIVNPANGTVAPWPFTDKSGNAHVPAGRVLRGRRQPVARSASATSASRAWPPRRARRRRRRRR